MYWKAETLLCFSDCIVKAMVFLVVTYCFESWIIKKAVCLWSGSWRRLLKVPWTPRRSNQSFLREINTEYSLEGLMLKLKLQYYGHLMGRTDLESLKSRSKGDDTAWDGWMASPIGCTLVWESSRSWWWIGKSGLLQFMESQRAGHNLATYQQDVTADHVRAE